MATPSTARLFLHNLQVLSRQDAKMNRPPTGGINSLPKAILQALEHTANQNDEDADPLDPVPRLYPKPGNFYTKQREEAEKRGLIKREEEEMPSAALPLPDPSAWPLPTPSALPLPFPMPTDAGAAGVGNNLQPIDCMQAVAEGDNFRSRFQENTSSPMPEEDKNVTSLLTALQSLANTPVPAGQAATPNAQAHHMAAQLAPFLVDGGNMNAVSPLVATMMASLIDKHNQLERFRAAAAGLPPELLQKVTPLLAQSQAGERSGASKLHSANDLAATIPGTSNNSGPNTAQNLNFSDQALSQLVNNREVRTFVAHKLIHQRGVPQELLVSNPALFNEIVRQYLISQGVSATAQTSLHSQRHPPRRTTESSILSYFENGPAAAAAVTSQQHPSNTFSSRGHRSESFTPKIEPGRTDEANGTSSSTTTSDRVFCSSTTSGSSSQRPGLGLEGDSTAAAATPAEPIPTPASTFPFSAGVGRDHELVRDA